MIGGAKSLWCVWSNYIFSIVTFPFPKSFQSEIGKIIWWLAEPAENHILWSKEWYTDRLYCFFANFLTDNHKYSPIIVSLCPKHRLINQHEKITWKWATFCVIFFLIHRPLNYKSCSSNMTKGSERIHQMTYSWIQCCS